MCLLANDSMADTSSLAYQKLRIAKKILEHTSTQNYFGGSKGLEKRVNGLKYQACYQRLKFETSGKSK